MRLGPVVWTAVLVCAASGCSGSGPASKGDSVARGTDGGGPDAAQVCGPAGYNSETSSNAGNPSPFR
jgi:hypothetical protein